MTVTRHRGYGLQPAIVEQAVLKTNLSANGVSQTTAIFNLRTKVNYLEVLLPAGLGFLVGLCGRQADQAADRERPDPVEFAGLADGRPLHATDNLPDARRPLSHRQAPRPACADAGAAPTRKVKAWKCRSPNSKWNLTLPNGYEVTRTLGTVLSPIEPPEPAALCVLKIAGAMLFCPAGIGKVMRASSEEAQFLEGPLDGVKSEMRAGMVKSGPKSKPPVAFAPSRKLPRRRPRENLMKKMRVRRNAPAEAKPAAAAVDEAKPADRLGGKHRQSTHLYTMI